MKKLLLLLTFVSLVIFAAPLKVIAQDTDYKEKYFLEIQKSAEDSVDMSNLVIDVTGVMLTVIGVIVIVQLLRNENQLKESNKVLKQIKEQKKELETIMEAFKDDTQVTEKLAREIQDYFQKAKKDYEYISQRTDKIKKSELLELLVNKRSDSIETSSSSINKLIKRM